MAERKAFGKKGEDEAAAYLKAKGYVILERNWRIRHKEVDIIALDGETLVIVEVKTRETAGDTPADLIDYRKRLNLLYAGEAYIRKKKMEREIRFDLILITGEKSDIRHIPDVIQVFD